MQSDCNKELQEQRNLIKGLEILTEEQREAIEKLESRVVELKERVQIMLSEKNSSDLISKEEETLLKVSTSATASSPVSVGDSSSITVSL